MSFKINDKQLKDHTIKMKARRGVSKMRLSTGLRDAAAAITNKATRITGPGGVFKHATGQLKKSIKLLHMAGSLKADIVTNVVYGPIQEFGGQTPPHIIRPRYKKVLAWGGQKTKSGKLRTKGGVGQREFFAKEVHHPGSKIPGVGYMRKAHRATERKVHQVLARAGVRILTG